MTKAIIQLENVWKIYQMGEVQLVALREVCLDIGRGEFVAILGPSGSGKSTLLHLVGCLDLPSKGRILLDGQDITELGESQLSQTRGRKIGFVFQQFNLMPTLNTLENVMLPLEFQDVDVPLAKEKALEALRLVDLEGRAGHLPSQLSGGERQRVAIARAIAGEPEIILADEPTGNLDSKTGRYILDFLVKTHESGKTIVMVTHDLDLVKRVERVVHIKDARIEKTNMQVVNKT
jgi:putative ABC transport system ATP-binding protein